ncbi:MAG: lipid-A-disaccharide synthase [Gammaproteobacteria bacterium]|nr:lipid-A-disaccharide synthase [Gammaproteobacteria bacterium]
MTTSVMLVAGETSGDHHGAALAQRLRQTRPDLKIFGMGSQHMRSADVELLVDCKNIAVVGIVEVLAHWSEIQAALKTLRSALANRKPDLLILIDYPEFNLKLAEAAKALGIKVLFYISPQIWAWRSYRVKRIGKLVDMMAVVFPFEVSFYQQAGIPVRFVGHPLAQSVKPKRAIEDAKKYFGLNLTSKTVALMPGSRRGEIKRLLPVMLDAAAILQQDIQNVQFILPIAPNLDRHAIQQQIDSRKLTITLVDSHEFYDVINIADAAITASGTATLETALLGTPMVIIYKVAPLSYSILRHLIKIKNIGLANIVAERTVVPELIQDNASSENIAREIQLMLIDDLYNKKLRDDLAIVKEKLGQIDGTEGISQLALEMLEQ